MVSVELAEREFEIKLTSPEVSKKPLPTRPPLRKDPRSSDFQSTGCFNDHVLITNEAFFWHFGGTSGCGIEKDRDNVLIALAPLTTENWKFLIFVKKLNFSRLVALNF